jgi:hypothetical protein
MAKVQPLKTNFAAGELAPEIAMRRDTKQYRDGAKSLLNSRVLLGGGVKRRSGTERITTTPNGDSFIFEFIYNQTTQYVLVFSAERMDAYSRDPDTGVLTAAGNVTSCPWTGKKFKTMDVCVSGNTIIVTHPDFLHTIVRTGASTWVADEFPFYIDAQARVHEPHTKVAANATTILPSALGGSITLTTSAAHWTADYVGKRIRVIDREVEITAYTSSTVVTATVLQPLRPYQDLTVASSIFFAVDDVVEGETSGAKGIVLAVPNATTVSVVITEALTKFEAEELIGPNGHSTISAVADASPLPVRDWSEALYHVTTGFPRCAVIHRGRILFGGSAAAPSALAGSSIINIFDFDVGTGSDSEGFLETIGDTASITIIRLHSTEQLLVLTDSGPYYVPESAQNVFRPSSLAFNKFGGNWPALSTRTVDFDGGVLYLSGSIVIKLAPTGSNTAFWDATEKSFLCPHLIRTPVDICVVDNYLGGPERYACIVNADGTLAVMQLIDAEEIRNFVPWQTTGEFKSACALFGQIYAVVRRDSSASTYYLETFLDELSLDSTVEFADETALNAGKGAAFGTATVNVCVTDGETQLFHLGTYPLNHLPYVPPGPYQVGFFYDRNIELMPPNIEDSGGNMAGDLMRIVEATVHVLESARFAANGYELQAYQINKDTNLPPPHRTGPRYFQFLGWEVEPTITITQPDPMPLTVLAIGTKVSF